jgi:hypothetical protein
MIAAYAVAAFIAVLIAVFIREHWSRTHGPLKFVIAMGAQSKWQTRPPVMRMLADKELVGAVARALEEAGFASPKVLLFQGQPTMDLILDPGNTRTTLTELSVLLQAWPVRIEAFRGNRLPLRYH